MGSSSGGLVVLGMLVDHPEHVAGGIALYPVSDLADLTERSHRFEAHYPLGLVGPAGDPAYAERSPLHHADRIPRPLLLMHGDADPVVPVEHSRALVDAIRALDARGVDVSDLVLRRPTLDDVFLSLTGHVAEEETAVEPKGRKRRERKAKS